MIGKKDEQALPLMYHLAARGWVCVAANYRLSPRATFPDHLIDVKRALAWIKQPRRRVRRRSRLRRRHRRLGGRTPRDAGRAHRQRSRSTSRASRRSTRRCRPACPSTASTTSSTATASAARPRWRPFSQRLVMKSLARDRARAPGSRPRRSRASTPTPRPSSLIHGTHDSLAYVEDTRHFVAALRAVSRQPVVYAELPGAQHAFDIFHSTRSAYAVEAVTRFVERRRRRATRRPAPRRPPSRRRAPRAEPAAPDATAAAGAASTCQTREAAHTVAGEARADVGDDQMPAAGRDERRHLGDDLVDAADSRAWPVNSSGRMVASARSTSGGRITRVGTRSRKPPWSAPSGCTRPRAPPGRGRRPERHRRRDRAPHRLRRAPARATRRAPRGSSASP